MPGRADEVAEGKGIQSVKAARDSRRNEFPSRSHRYAMRSPGMTADSI